MNRRERRRAAKLGDIVEIKLGRVVFDIKPGENAPDMKISEGGTYNDVDEIREIADAIKERGDKSTN